MTVTDKDRFSGPYEGTVVSGDPTGRSDRLLVRVPDVLGDDPCIWAEALNPIAGVASGSFVAPLPNSGVVVHFLNGDIDRAVWTGFWRGGLGDMPPIARRTPPGTPQISFSTPGQNYLLITDLPGPTGGIQIQVKGPAGPSIKISETVIELSCGPGLATIKLGPGPAVSINNGALTVDAPPGV